MSFKEYWSEKPACWSHSHFKTAFMSSFLEEYTLLDELGQGGYATVYKVRHNQLGYVRAVRVLNAIIAHGESDPAYQKFLDECRLLLRLGNGNHPHIVHIYRPLLRAQRAIVEMDYVDGLDLYHYLEKRSGFVESSDVVRLLTEIGSALAYCHEDIYAYCMSKDEDHLQDDPNDGSRPLVDEPTRQRLIEKYRVIHNDIHSGNIIRRDNGDFVLLDFGLAVEGDSVVRSSRRKNGAPEFKSPEKWDNDGILTPQSDIYSFGIVLYEYLAGRVPFPFDTQNSNQIEEEYMLSRSHKEQMPPSILALRKAAFERTHPGEVYQQDYPQWLEDIIMKCLSKNPSDRFASGKELYETVEKCKAGQPMAPHVPLTPNPSIVIPTVALPTPPFSTGGQQTSHVEQTRSAPYTPPPRSSSSGSSAIWAVIIIILVFLLVAIGVGGYFLYDRYNDLLFLGNKKSLVVDDEKDKDEKGKYDDGSGDENEKNIMPLDTSDNKKRVLSSDVEPNNTGESYIDDGKQKIKSDVIDFISEYYAAARYYAAERKGDLISYFEYDDITFFDLEHVDRSAILKRFQNVKQRRTEHDFDWKTLDIVLLSSGAIRAIYSFDYYIYYDTKTDKYRITSEMVISANKKIKSIKDLETIKVDSYSN